MLTTLETGMILRWEDKDSFHGAGITIRSYSIVEDILAVDFSKQTALVRLRSLHLPTTVIDLPKIKPEETLVTWITMKDCNVTTLVDKDNV